jgi:transcriptional regulator with XRE-family HTH domain
MAMIGKPKLTDRDVILIQELKAIRADLLRQAGNLTDRKIAEKFEVSANTVQKIPVMM